MLIFHLVYDDLWIMSYEKLSKLLGSNNKAYAFD